MLNSLIEQSINGDKDLKDKKLGEAHIRCKECKNRTRVDLFDEDCVFICAACGENYFYVPPPGNSEKRKQSTNKSEMLDLCE